VHRWYASGSRDTELKSTLYLAVDLRVQQVVLNYQLNNVLFETVSVLGLQEVS